LSNKAPAFYGKKMLGIVRRLRWEFQHVAPACRSPQATAQALADSTLPIEYTQ
jgi:hypothetical protein